VYHYWSARVWRDDGLRIVPTVDVPIVDVLGEVPHVMHPADNVTHPAVHVVYVLVGLSCEGDEVGVHLNHLLIKYLDCDLALSGYLWGLPG
jgi:hypothetical protein